MFGRKKKKQGTDMTYYYLDALKINRFRYWCLIKNGMNCFQITEKLMR